MKDEKIYVAGHRGTAGSAIVKLLKERGFSQIITKTHAQLDLTNQSAVAEFFATERPAYVILAAVRLGHLGERAPASVLYENCAMQSNVFYHAHLAGVKKLIFFGSSWMYPKEANNPIKEEELLKGELDWAAEPYGLAKIMGLKLAEAYNLQYGMNFLCLSLTNLYGESADFDFAKAKVLPAILRKIHLAKLLSQNKQEEIMQDLGIPLQNGFKEALLFLERIGITHGCVELWGSGKVRREFIHSLDLASASLHVLEHVDVASLYDPKSKEPKNMHINVGTNSDLSICELALLIQEVVGFEGEIKFDPSKPDSSMNRLMDCSKIHALGWRHSIELKEGIGMLYHWYQTNKKERK